MTPAPLFKDVLASKLKSTIYRKAYEGKSLGAVLSTRNLLEAKRSALTHFLAAHPEQRVAVLEDICSNDGRQAAQLELARLTFNASETFAALESMATGKPFRRFWMTSVETSLLGGLTKMDRVKARFGIIPRSFDVRALLCVVGDNPQSRVFETSEADDQRENMISWYHKGFLEEFALRGPNVPISEWKGQFRDLDKEFFYLRSKSDDLARAWFLSRARAAELAETEIKLDLIELVIAAYTDAAAEYLDGLTEPLLKEVRYLTTFNVKLHVGLTEAESLHWSLVRADEHVMHRTETHLFGRPIEELANGAPGAVELTTIPDIASASRQTPELVEHHELEMMSLPVGRTGTSYSAGL